MKRMSFFLYGVGAHLAFLAVYAYLAGFVGNFLVPKSIDSGERGAIAWALVADLGLIALFGLQHSIMARPWWKAIWTRIVPAPIERSTYVWISNVLVVLLVWLWQPIGVTVWDVQQPIGRAALTSLFAIGWLLVPLASLMIDHFDLFGTRQVWLHLRGREYAPPAFRTPLLYGKVRHPLYVGWMIAFWATPTMTLGHLIFAAALTCYMLIAVRFEERDLSTIYGREYADYQRRVPGFLPRLASRSSKERAGAPVAAGN
jgi:protein-S-isoprenylcysteine O-methyltransferase Ste14